MRIHEEVASSIGLTVSFTKTKFMVIGSAVSEEVRQPVAVDDGLIECANHFSYLGSVIMTENYLYIEIDVRIAKAFTSKAFGALHCFL